MASVTRVAALLACLMLASASQVSAANPTWPDCYDAKVVATLVGQTPTDMPGCDDCFIMRWPWILDYRVHRVVEGSVARGPLTVLSLEHTYYSEGLGPRTLVLRRNKLGGFNQVHAFSHTRRCPRSAGPVDGYVQPPPGVTLDDLRREGEARYGKRPRQEQEPTRGLPNVTPG